MDPGLGSFRMNRYSGTDETTNFHEYNDDGGGGGVGGGIGGVSSFGRNLSTCFGGRGLNTAPRRMGAGRGYMNSKAQDDGYYTTADSYGSQLGLGNDGGFSSPASRPGGGGGQGGYFSAGNNLSPFGGVSRGGMGRGRPSLLADPAEFDDSGFSGSGRIGGARMSGGSAFRTNNATSVQPGFFNDKQYRQEYSSNQYQDEDLEPPPKYHAATYSSMETRGPVFKRGGLRGVGANRSSQGSRSGGGGSRYSNKSGSGGGGNDSGRGREQSNTRRPEAAPKSTELSPSPKKSSDKPVSTKIGVHLDITPPIFKEMTNRGLGDKVFIMIPKEAKSVMDVKIHVAKLLGVDVYLVNFFINGFRIPENEDVEAFACISSNALVQVVKPGYRPPCDLSKFSKTNEDKSAPSIATSHSKVEELEAPSNKPKDHAGTGNELEALEHDHAPTAISERKRRQNYMEPSLLEPPARRSRHSYTSQADAPNVTMLTPITRPITNSSPSKTVIEIVLSDDEDEDDGAMAITQVTRESKDNANSGPTSVSTPSTDSSSDKLVIEEGTGEGDKQKYKSVVANSSTGGGCLEPTAEGEQEVFTVEDEVGGSNSPKGASESVTTITDQGQDAEHEQGQGPSTANSKIDSRSQVNQTGNDQIMEQTDGAGGSGSENWLNAAGQVVGRGRKSHGDANINEVVDLSSSEQDEGENEEGDDGSSTTFEEEEESFFTIKPLQSIPVGVFRSIGEEEEKAVTAKRNSRLTTTKNDCQQMGNENWDTEVTKIQQNLRPDEVQTLNLGTRSSLMNPFAKQPQPQPNFDAHVAPSSISEPQPLGAVTKPKTDQEMQLPPPPVEKGTPLESTVTDETVSMEVYISRRNTSPIDEVNQIKCGSVILYQIMETEGEKAEAEKSAGAGAGVSGPQQLSEVKCCKVIGRCDLKLTLEPLQDGEISDNSTNSTKETESGFPTQRKFVFVDFKDMINLQEVVQEAS